MQNPANFGLAKAFLTHGLASGFDMTTPEGMQAWTETYNAGLRMNMEQPQAQTAARATSRATRTTAARRKLAQRSRRANRKKR
jgi:hypothetical protein